MPYGVHRSDNASGRRLKSAVTERSNSPISLRTLRTAEFKKRQKALKYLIHFVGDLHQPLHAGDNHDRGGNDVQVEFLGQTINPYNRKPWNLHAVWDSGILEEHDRDAHHYADRLNAWLRSQLEGAFQDGSVVDWAVESHDIAKDHVYVLPENRKLGDDYYRANVPVVDQQLAKAGVRIAKLLNEALRKK
jgi:nuclease S1